MAKRRTRSARAASLKVYGWLVAIGVGLVGGGPGFGAAPNGGDAEPLEAGIRQARAVADYASALEQARSLLAVLHGDGSAADWEVGDAERLVATLERAAALDEQAREELAEADALDAVQREQFESSRAQEACETAATQLEIRRRHLGDENQETARTLHWRAECLAMRGKLVEALAAAERSLELRRALLGRQHPEVADSLHRIASTCWTMALLDESEAAAREALALRRELYPEPDATIAVSLNRLGQILDVAGKDAEGLVVLEEALEMRRALFGETRYDVAETLSSMARIYSELGDLVTAEELRRRSHAIVGQVLDRDDLRFTWSLGGLADILQRQGAFAEAQELLEEVLAIQRRTRGEDDFHVSRTLHVIALLEDRQGRHAEAIATEEEALRIAEKTVGPDHVQIAGHLEVLGDALRAQGDHEGAVAAHRRALAIMESSELSPYEVTDSMVPLARDALERGDLDEALDLTRRVVERYVAQFGEAHPGAADGHALLSQVLEARGDRKGAVTEMERAARSFEAARLRVGAGVRRATFLRSPYDRLAALYLENGREALAWPTLEKARGRVLAEVLVAAGHRRLTAGELQRSETLRKELVVLDSRTRALETRDESREERPAELEALRVASLQAEQAWDAFQAEMEAKYPLTGGESFTLARVQSALEPGDAVVGWLDMGSGAGDRAVSWGYVLRKQGPVRWTRLEPEARTRQASLARLARARQALSAAPPSAFLGPPGRYADPARDLWHRRFRPLETHLKGAGRLIVVPSAFTQGLPVETLLDDEERFLGDRFEVTYTPSSTVMAWIRERPDQAARRPGLLIGDPPFNEAHARAMGPGAVQQAALDPATLNPAVLRSVLARDAAALGTLPRLPGSRREVAALAGLSPGMESLVGPAASEQTLTRMARRGTLDEFRLLHFATHAVIDRERPSRSAIVLSQVGLTDPFRPDDSGRAYDGLIMGHEIAREWKLDAELVTLSACETALGRPVPGEGSVGLAHTFFQVGARSLLLSLWQVDDHATSLLMERFYANWLGRDGGDAPQKGTAGMSKSRALAEAKRWLRDYEDDRGQAPYAHPYYWSAFVLLGDPD